MREVFAEIYGIEPGSIIAIYLPMLLYTPDLFFVGSLLTALSTITLHPPAGSLRPPTSASTSSPKKTNPIMTHQQPIGPHGGQIVENKENRFEVKLDPEKGSVSVYTLRAKNALPQSLSITLYESKSKAHTVQLTAVDPAQALPQYQGNLPLANASYIGLAIRLG